MGLRIGKGKVSRYDAERENRNSIWFYVQNRGNFAGMSKLDSFDSYAIPSDFESAPTLADMFMNCSNLKKVCKINALSAKSCGRMFKNCKALASAEVNAPSSTDYSEAFAECISLKSAIVSGADKTKNFCKMLYNDYNLERLSDLDLSSATNTSYMFYNCHSLKSANLVNMSSAVTNVGYMFYYCYAMESVPKGLALDGATDMRYIFRDCWKLESVALSTPSATNMEGMFYNCSHLKSVSALDTEKVSVARWIFYGCGALVSLPSSMFSSGLISTAYSMFNGCGKLASVPEDINTSRVTDMRYMFQYCYALKSVPALDASKVTINGYLDYMFRACYALEEIHMTGMKVSFDISASTKFAREALVEIIGNLATVASTKTLTMGSTNLAKLTDDDKAVATGKGWTLR